MDHSLMRIIFNFVNWQSLFLLIFLFINIGFQAKNKHQLVQSDSLSNFILILALCESLNFFGNAVLKDFFIANRMVTISVGITIIIISWLTAIGFTIWNFRYLKKLGTQTDVKQKTNND